MLRLLEDNPDGRYELAWWALTDCNVGVNGIDVWRLVSWRMWFKPMPARIALAVKWAIAKVRELEDDDVQAQAMLNAAGWTKAAQAMFAEGLGKGAAK
jgi:hypothetical protein